MRQEGQRDRYEFDMDERAEWIPTRNWSDLHTLSKSENFPNSKTYIKLVDIATKKPETMVVFQCMYSFQKWDRNVQDSNGVP